MKRYCPQSVVGQIKGMVHANVNVAHNTQERFPETIRCPSPQTVKSSSIKKN
jgi:hypothetical protein